jgi:hypothetical protein
VAQKTLLLINPVDKKSYGFAQHIRTHYQPLNPGVIAALTPRDWKIKIMDENIRDFRFSVADL